MAPESARVAACADATNRAALTQALSRDEIVMYGLPLDVKLAIGGHASRAGAGSQCATRLFFRSETRCRFGWNVSGSPSVLKRLDQESCDRLPGGVARQREKHESIAQAGHGAPLKIIAT